MWTDGVDHEEQEEEEEEEELGLAGRWKGQQLLPPRSWVVGAMGGSSSGYLDQFERHHTPVLPPRPHVVSGRKAGATPSSGATTADAVSPSLGTEATPDNIRGHIPLTLTRVSPSGPGNTGGKGHRSAGHSGGKDKLFRGIKFVITGIDPSFSPGR
jgi:hypothetical protein